MNLLQTLYIILQMHLGYVSDCHEIESILETYGIWFPTYIIRNVIEILYDHPRSEEDDPVHGVDWCMQGFRLILRGIAADDTSEQITMRLGEQGYGWSLGFVGELILTYSCWTEWGNGDPS